MLNKRRLTTRDFFESAHEVSIEEALPTGYNTRESRADRLMLARSSQRRRSKSHEWA